MDQQNLDQNSTYYLRMHLYHRLLHGLLITSFLGLAASGMPLRFNQAPWAINLAHASGGFGAILFFHKFFAALLTLCFLLHIFYVFHLVFIRREASALWGPTSMIPQPKDILDMYQHFRWFFGMGPRPQFGWFTYWEKFDYWAVFWGMAIIGGTGYVMWFSASFAHFLPGWMFNIALLIHADEALLAVWFIFAIHFFNSHLRPEKFPMDLVIFTGRESLEEFHESRPAEYERLEKGKGLETIKSDAPPLWLRNFGRIIGFTAIGIGFLLFALTLMAFLNE
jgi:cytochrome b subunit of formate dehydrogenase